MKLFQAFKSISSYLNSFREDDLVLLNRACQSGDLEKIDKLFTKKNLRINPIPVESIFTSATMHGQLEIIDYLLTSPHTKEFQKPDLRMDRLLQSAAIHGQQKIITYFLLLDTKKYHRSKDKENIALHYLSQLLHFDVIEYLIKSPLFKDKIDLHTNNDILFIQAFNNKKDDLLDYLIFERNLEKTEKINTFLNDRDLHSKNNPYPHQIKHMFEVRDLKNELKTNKGHTQKRIKV